MIACIASRIAPVCLGAAWAKAMVTQSNARIFFRNLVATGEIYPLNSEVGICDESRTRDAATVEMTERDRVLANHTIEKEFKPKAIGHVGSMIDAGGIFAYATKAEMISSAAA